MSDTLILYLPQSARFDAATDDIPAPTYWARVADGQMVASGTGDGWRDAGRAPFANEVRADMCVLALAPASDAPVRFVQVNAASPQQAAAAARAGALATVLGDPAEAHIVAAVPVDVAQAFPMTVTSHAAMRRWVAWLEAQGFAQDGAAKLAICPVAAILPPPEGDGLVSVELGGETIIRSVSHAYASDPALDPLMRGEAVLSQLSAEDMTRALVFAASLPPLDLLSGPYAPKQNWGLSAAQRKWLKILAISLLLLSLAVPVVQAVKLGRDRDRADAAVIAEAARLGINAADAAGAEAEMDRRLAQRSSGPLAFTVPASALYGAMADAPAAALKSLSHRGDGTLSAQIAAPRSEDINPVLLALQARGYRITAQPMAGSDGQQLANVTIRAVP